MSLMFKAKLNLAVKLSLLGLILVFALVNLSGCTQQPAEATITPTLTATQTETPTATIDWFPATPTSTLAPLPSPTPQPTLEDSRTGLIELLIDDNFTDQNLWATRQSSVGNIAYGNQNLSLAVSSPNTRLSSVSQHSLPEEFYLEITIQPTICEPSDQVGVLFWYQSESDYYRLLIDCTGQVRLELIQAGQSFVLQDWMPGQQVLPGPFGINRLGLYVSRGQFQLYINDVLQFNRTIASRRNGGLGVFARTISGSTLTVRFSDLQVFLISAE